MARTKHVRRNHGTFGGKHHFGHPACFGDRPAIKEHRYLVSLRGTDDYVDKATGIRVLPAARFPTAFV